MDHYQHGIVYLWDSHKKFNTSIIPTMGPRDILIQKPKTQDLEKHVRWSIQDHRSSLNIPILRTLISDEELERISTADCVMKCAVGRSTEKNRFEVTAQLYLPQWSNLPCGMVPQNNGLTDVPPYLVGGLSTPQNNGLTDVPPYLVGGLSTQERTEIKRDLQVGNHDILARMLAGDNYVESRVLLSYPTDPRKELTPYATVRPVGMMSGGINQTAEGYANLSAEIARFLPHVSFHLMEKLRQKQRQRENANDRIRLAMLKQAEEARASLANQQID